MKFDKENRKFEIECENSGILTEITDFKISENVFLQFKRKYKEIYCCDENGNIIIVSLKNLEITKKSNICQYGILCLGINEKLRKIFAGTEIGIIYIIGIFV